MGIFGEGDAVNARRVDEPRRAITMSTPNGTRQMRATDSHGLLGWKQRYSTDLKMAHLDQLCSQFSRTASGLPLLRPDYRDRPPSAEPFVDKRDRMHQFMLNAASDGRGRSAKIPTSTMGIAHMRVAAAHGNKSDACYGLAPTQSLRRSLRSGQTGRSSAPPLVEPLNPPLPKGMRLGTAEGRINHHFPLCTAYQLTHGSIDVLPDLGLSKPLHYHPRDQMTDYREDIKKSTGKVSFFIRSADEVAQYKGKSSFNFNVDHHTDGSRKDPPNTLPGFSDAKLARFRGTWKG